NANGTSVVATPLYISAAGEVVAPTINATGALKSQGTYNRTTTAAANTHISDSASGHHFYRSTSSQRWKTNINAADLEEIRKALLKILVVNFTSLCECDDPDKVHTGFIAEQLAEIDRRMATYGTDDDGNEQVEGFDSNELISRTVAGWQIHEMEINRIKAKAAKFDALSALLVS
ncbi:tail fiber domain-containing protein, partial [Christensenella minuta]